MAGKRKSQRSSRNQKPKYSFEEPEASVEIATSSSSSMEAVAAKQVDIILKTLGAEPFSATSTCEKAVLPGTEKSVRTIAINLTVSEDQIRSWLGIPCTENFEEQTKKKATRSAPKATSRRAGKHTMTEKRKTFVLAKIARDLSGEKAAEFGTAESIEKIAKSIHVPPGHMRKWLGITDDLSQIIANSNLKVRGFQPKMEESEEKEAAIETVPLDDENIGEMEETQNDSAETPDALEEAEDVTERLDELLEVGKGNESPEKMAEVPEDSECPEKVPEDNECPEKASEDKECPEKVPEDKECLEESAEVPTDNDKSLEELLEGFVAVLDEVEEVPKVNEGPEELVEVPKDKCPEGTVEVPKDKCPEGTVEVPKDKCPEEMVEVPKDSGSLEEMAEVPKDIESPEEMAEVLNDIEGPEEEAPQPEAARQSPIPITFLPMIDGETVKLVAYESFDDDDEASSSVGEIEMSNNDNLDNVSSSSEHATAEQTCEMQLIGTNNIGNGEDENPPEKKKAAAIAEPEVPIQDIPQQQQSSSLANSKSDEMDTGSISPKDVAAAMTPTPAKRKTRIDDYFPKLKNMRKA